MSIVTTSNEKWEQNSKEENDEKKVDGGGSNFEILLGNGLEKAPNVNVSVNGNPVNNVTAGEKFEKNGNTEQPAQKTKNLSDNITTMTRGSSILGASLNFSNTILGAGVVGYGGAIAKSGGLVSVTSVLVFAVLTKLSFDIVIELALETNATNSSYEDLGRVAFGTSGYLAVAISKGLFAFGCLVAYVVICKLSFAPACRSLFLEDPSSPPDEGIASVFFDETWSTLFLSATVMLPLSLMRDMALLEKFSAAKIGIFMLIILILIYLGFTISVGDVESASNYQTFQDHWLAVKPGFLQSTGTFVFAFVTQHMCHIVYHSLRPEDRNLDGWKKVSTLSVALAALLSLLMGFTVYMTFWEAADSNMFGLYPPSPAVDTARILLCIEIILTYPPAFFSCRDLIISFLPQGTRQRAHDQVTEKDGLLGRHLETRWWLLPGDERQLIRPLHVVLTTALWASTVCLALAAPSLGDVLNLVGCAAGTGTCSTCLIC
jgi:sodium-coupled neutral amino acid transporter 11